MAAKTLNEILNSYIERYNVEWEELEQLFGEYTGLNARGAYLKVIAMNGTTKEFKAFIHDWFSDRDEEGDGHDQ